MANLTARRAGLLPLLLFALAGCQTGGNTELLERQLRIQEDRIYQLEDELERHCKMVQACRKENQALKASPASSASQPATTQPSTSPLKSDSEPKSSSPPAVMPGDLTPPKLELDLPPVPPPTSSSDLPPLPGPRLSDAEGSEPIAGGASDSSTLHIRVPERKQPSTTPKGDERVVDQSAGSNIAPQAYYQRDSDTSPAAARRPTWSPYR